MNGPFRPCPFAFLFQTSSRLFGGTRAALSFQKSPSVKTAPRLNFRTLMLSFSGSTDLTDGQKVFMRNTKKPNNQEKKRRETAKSAVFTASGDGRTFFDSSGNPPRGFSDPAS
jgi:hypothetical protein